MSTSKNSDSALLIAVAVAAFFLLRRPSQQTRPARGFFGSGAGAGGTVDELEEFIEFEGVQAAVTSVPTLDPILQPLLGARPVPVDPVFVGFLPAILPPPPSGPSVVTVIPPVVTVIAPVVPVVPPVTTIFGGGFDSISFIEDEEPESLGGTGGFDSISFIEDEEPESLGGTGGFDSISFIEDEEPESLGGTGGFDSVSFVEDEEPESLGGTGGFDSVSFVEDEEPESLAGGGGFQDNFDTFFEE